MVLTAWLALIAAIAALLTALVAVRRVEHYRLTAPQVRELVREIEDTLDKLAVRQAREGMRKLRSDRRETPPPPPTTEEESSPSARDPKGELWQIVRDRGLGRGR